MGVITGFRILFEAYKAEWEFYLRVIQKFKEMMGMMNFSLWTLHESPDYQTAKRFLSYYTHLNELFSMWMTFSLLINEIEPTKLKYGRVSGWFANWDLYKDARFEYDKLNIDEKWYEKFDDYFMWMSEFLPLTPQLKAASTFCDDPFEAMEWLAKHFYGNFIELEDNPQTLFSRVYDEFEELAMTNLDLTPDTAGWYIIRPVWPLEWALLKTHVQAELFYRDWFTQKLDDEFKVIPPERLPTEWSIGGNTLKEGGVDSEGANEFVADPEFIQNNRGKNLEFESKGLTANFEVEPTYFEDLNSYTPGLVPYYFTDENNCWWRSKEGWNGAFCLNYGHTTSLDTFGCDGHQQIGFFKYIKDYLFIQLYKHTNKTGDEYLRWRADPFDKIPLTKSDDECEYTKRAYWTNGDIPKKSLFIIDGDTFLLPVGDEESYYTRLVGVDTPETRGENRPEEYDGLSRDILRRYGEKATEEVEKILTESDYSVSDDEIMGKYGVFDRRLFYVSTDRGDLGLHLLREGLARVYSEADFDKKEEYENYERVAKENNKGMWRHL